jgi:hypothetical protein
MESEHLNVWQLFDGIYLGLVTRFPARTLRYAPPAGASAEVADDSDGHRTRTGVMSYQELSVITVGPKEFLIGVGKPHGYPADPFATDLLVIPLEEKIPEVDWDHTVFRIIEESTYFKNTMILGLREGNTTVPKQSIYAKPAQTYLSDISAAVANEPKFNPRHMHGDGRAATEKNMLFKRNSLTFFVDGCTAVLAASM